VRPAGKGTGSDDHKVLFDYKLLAEELESVGFDVRLLEYWDENRCFQARRWSSEDGHIERSRLYDPRNQDGSLTYTSIVADAIKPKVLR
jgi:predicted SAM-dependent methyltransferase